MSSNVDFVVVQWRKNLQADLSWSPESADTQVCLYVHD
jgi:hypothetical protein